MRFFLDTSALVKQYRNEPGAELVRELLDNVRFRGDQCYVSLLCHLELTSAFIRLARGRQLSLAAVQQILSRYREDVGELFHVWPLSEQVMKRAIPIVEEYGLRAADALHLATASFIASEVATRVVGLPSIVVVTGDTELLGAAELAGLGTLNPLARNAMEQLRLIRG